MPAELEADVIPPSDDLLNLLLRTVIDRLAVVAAIKANQSVLCCKSDEISLEQAHALPGSFRAETLGSFAILG